jgi:hypothetical protein
MDRHKTEGDPVVVWDDVLEGIDAVRATGLTNMLDRSAVAQLAGALGHIAAMDWIRANPTVYGEGIFRGFVAKDPWDAPILDFEDCRCGCGGRRECGDEREP